MSKAPRLNTEDRQFFSLLAEIIFSNPFSPERNKVEALLGRTIASYFHPDEHQLVMVIPALENRLAALTERGITRVNDVAEQDRPLLQYAFLYLIYHSFTDHFDNLIHAQMELGKEPAKVSFFNELAVELQQRGFTEDEVLRYMELFYQFRRAYFFIARALVGDSASMRQLRHALWNNVFTCDVRLYGEHLWDRMEDFSTLLLGETGTGKGTAAVAIGRTGLIPYDIRKNCFKSSFMENFIAINLSEFPESLIESELFGHRKGSFTGAIDNHQGLFERCSIHGSLFLDEIGDVSIPVQIKLLNVLQNRVFNPVGSHETRRFEGRVIAATNRPLGELIAQGRFREDFYYRLSSDIIEVPPLRVRLQESPEELKQLVQLLVQRMTGTHDEAFVEHINGILERNVPAEHHWPGNVRELEQTVRRIIVNGSHPVLDRHPVRVNTWLKKLQLGQLSATDLLSGYCYRLYQELGTYENVAQKAGLDRRTAKKYVEGGRALFTI